jgi:hypothetical protein
VVVAAVLTAEVNVGYEDAVWKALRSVDGHEVRSLRGLMAAVERADGGPYLVFGLADGSRVTIDRARAVATAAEVLARYEVAWDRSAGLRGSRTGPAAPGAAGE